MVFLRGWGVGDEQKSIKSLKCKGVLPLLLVYGHVLAIVRKGCDCFRVARLRICDREYKLP